MNRRITEKRYKGKWRKLFATLIGGNAKPSRIKLSKGIGENEIIIKGTWKNIEGKIRFIRRESEADKAAE